MARKVKRVCLICVELFAWGKHGGYGKTARIIGRELVRRGYEVFAIVPQRPGQQREEHLDGMTVLSYKTNDLLDSGQLYRKVDADIYFSLEPNTGTWIAMTSVPHAVHLISCQNPKFSREWIQEFFHPSQTHLQVVKNYLYENNFRVKQAVRRADGVYVPAKYLADKVKKRYALQKQVDFLPAPIEMPSEVTKPAQPAVLYMGRLDRIKRPELALDLARNYPDVLFQFAGKARHPDYEQHLRQEYAGCDNIRLLGFVDQFSGEGHHTLFNNAWILINTSVREGLPNSFIEACGHQCAILSYVNPDGFSSKFGYHAERLDFREGLSWLLEAENWKKQGRAGFTYVRENYELERAMDMHEAAFQDAMDRKGNTKRILSS